MTENILTKKADKLCNYEMVVIIGPQVIDEQLETAINNITGFITGRGGAVSEMDRWGKRPLAYPIKHSVSGTYVLLRFALKPVACKELENNLKISDQVLRHLLIKLDGKESKKPIARPMVRAPAAPVAKPPAPAASNSNNVVAG